MIAIPFTETAELKESTEDLALTTPFLHLLETRPACLPLQSQDMRVDLLSRR